MGAWGHRNFENDSAMDWLNSFLVKPSEKALEERFNAILNQQEFIDSDESFEALTAGEIVAAMRMKQSIDFPKEISVKRDFKFLYDPTINWMAKKAVQKILNFSGHSELRELWLESDSYKDWENVQKDLMLRLS
jgi:hypothetical protein